MSDKVTFDYAKAVPFLGVNEIPAMKEKVTEAREKLVSGSGLGNDFLGWVDLPVNCKT